MPTPFPTPVPLPFPTPVPAPIPLPGPLQFNVTPTGTDFFVIIPGSDLVSGHTYQIRVFVDPASGSTPPNQDQSIDVEAE
jgi:hypothetical protein